MTEALLDLISYRRLEAYRKPDQHLLRKEPPGGAFS